MKKLLISLLPVLILCTFLIGCSNRKNADRLKITGFSYEFYYAKDSMIARRADLEKYKPYCKKNWGLDSIVFKGKENDSLVQYFLLHGFGGSIMNQFQKSVKSLAIAKRDSIDYAPQTIGPFELKGLYGFKAVTDSNFTCYYVNPQTMDVLEMDSWIGNGCIFGMKVYAHDSINPFKGNMKLLDKGMRLDLPDPIEIPDSSYIRAEAEMKRFKEQLSGKRSN